MLLSALPHTLFGRRVDVHETIKITACYFVRDTSYDVIELKFDGPKPATTLALDLNRDTE